MDPDNAKRRRKNQRKTRHPSLKIMSILNVLPFYRGYRRKQLARRPFPEHWGDILGAKFPFYNKFDPEERECFHTHLKIFLWEKYWEGAGGLEITEEIQVTVSAAAARIARHLPLFVYDRLTEIVVYPSHYQHPDDPDSIILGQAHHFGTIILSWDAVKGGIHNPHDGRDTAIHELAHVLDVADGLFDGTPQLQQGSDYPEWTRVMGQHFARLQDKPFRGVLRSYGAQNEAEFFAVATEHFFERPQHLKRRAPDLYQVLADYFRVEPK